MGRRARRAWIVGAAMLAIIGALLVLASGCQTAVGPAGQAGPTGPAGQAGPPGTSNGTITGKVTNSRTGAPVAGVAITLEPNVKQNIASGADGTYSVELPIGSYTLTLKQTGFDAATVTASVVAGQKTTRDVVLKATSAVVVSAGTAQTAAPGASVNLKATAQALDGSTITGYEWTQTAGPKVTIDNAKSDAIKVTLPNAAAYKTEIINGLKFEDRNYVVGINPHALTAGKTATLKVTVTTSSGKYTGTVSVTADLPYAFTTGIETVPIGVPALLHGKDQAAYEWAVTGPTGSKATIDDAASQNPVVIPDVVGKYTLTEKKSGAAVNLYGGTWAGAITGQDANGRPLSANCTSCHNDKVAPDKFTAWKESGHAEIFTQNLNDPNGHWSENCATCHTVGYDLKAKNGGFDEAMAAEGWKVPAHGDVGYWTTILAKFPKTAQLANIQCENCHGPNEGTGLHINGTLDAARISISSEGCGSCHGEPPRHGRFQQWEESGHGNFELAIEEATVETRAASAGHCGRCHSGQGFLAWIEQDDLTKRIQGAKGDATIDELKALGLTKDQVQPQTCVTCHDPHAQGKTSGEPNTATVRIEGSTKVLPAGFKATEVGSGALCMTCHNTRNGLHNDSVKPTNYSAPHTAAQADMLMGENAYLVGTGARSPHSYIQDTCATCHMEASPPPAEFSYQGAGTNHAFKASMASCASCHSSTLNGNAMKVGFEEELHVLGNKMSDYLLKKIADQVTIKDYTPHTFGGKSYDVKSNALVIQKSNIASLEPIEPHGQQGFLIKFKSPVTFTYKPANESEHTVTTSEAQFQLGDITTDGAKALIAIDDVLVKAGWNYFLIHGDGSGGIHNPAFTREIIENTIKALN